MSAPSPTVRGTPSGIKLDDGFSSKVTFEGNPTVSLWEKTTNPPDIDGGEKINTTTMHNTQVRTYAARHLYDFGNATFKAAYDPAVLTQIYSLINSPQAITFRFGDGSTWAFFGYLQKVEFDDLVEGQQAEATVTIASTNFDPVGKVEAIPVITSVSGT